MRIDFLGLSAFAAIAERGSFQQAAAHLNLSQTALSHRMRKLEDDLGVRLLSRSAREVALTPAGLELLPKVKGMIESLSQSLDDLRRGGADRQERLAIGCLPTLAAGRLPAILTRFRSRYPEVVVEIYDMSAGEIAGRVADGTIEFAITLLAAHRWDFEVELLAREPFVLICRDDHAFAAQATVAWAELDAVPLIRISRQTGNRMMIDDALGGRREHLNWRYEVQHVSTTVALVRAGLGMAVVPRLSVDGADQSGLHIMRLRNPAIVRQIGIVSRRGAMPSPLAAHLRGLVAEAFATERAEADEG